MFLPAGTQVAGYVIESVLGEGGLGVVYEAHQPTLRRQVALKLIDPQLAARPEFVARFEREAIAQAAIAHPHIVPVYEIGETAEGLFVAMQLVRGPTLKELISAGVLAPVQSVELLGPVAAAVDAAHAAGLVHHDIKPQNILVEAGLHPFLTDFGLAEAIGGPAAAGVSGTAAYAAPEQIAGAPDAASDIYALGATLYECLTARLPFPAASAAEALRAHRDDPPPKPSAVRPQLGDAVDAVIARALAKDPRQRPATAVALIQAAARALGEAESDDGLAITLPPSVGLPPRAASPQHPSPRARPPAVPRDRRLLLSRAAQSYSAFLEQTLGRTLRLNLALELEPDQTVRPADRVLPAQRRHGPLAPGVGLAEVLQRAGGVSGDGLLVLGAPGAGKTTLVVGLAAELMQRAERDPSHPVPVYLPLASWGVSRAPLEEWIVDQMHKLYKVSPTSGRRLLDRRGPGLLLVLDGLDEMAEHDARAMCARELSAFAAAYPVALVVTARRAEYEALNVQLELETAVRLRPLDPPVVLDRLRGSPEMRGVVAVLERDPALVDLLSSPLLVSMLTLAYRDREASDIPLAGPPETRLDHLIDDYVGRRYDLEVQAAQAGVPYSLEHTRAWLRVLATDLAAHQQPIFLLERIRPDTLVSPRAERLVEVSPKLVHGLCSGLITAAVAAEISGLLHFRELPAAHIVIWLAFGIVAGVVQRSRALTRLAAWTLVGLACGLIYSLLIDIRDAQGLLFQGLYYLVIFVLVGELLVRLVPPVLRPAERLAWSWSRAQPYVLPGLLVGMVGGPLFGLLFSLSIEAQGASVSGRGYWLLLFGPLFGLLWALSRGIGRGLIAAPRSARRRPNEGIRLSARYGLLVGVVTLLAIDALTLLGFGLWALVRGPDDLGLEFAIAMLLATGWGMGTGLLLGIACGGGAAIQHWTLRLVLWRHGLAPLRYAHFLAFAVRLRVLYWGVGGGHMFIHKVVQDHFAAEARATEIP